METREHTTKPANNWIGLAVVALPAVPTIVWGLHSIITQHHESTGRILSTVTILDGAPAVAAGFGYLGLGMALIAVGVAQWPHLRRFGIRLGAVSMLAAAGGFVLSILWG